jgi:glycosyltransferase involved in cell wall biosynthesis
MRIAFYSARASHLKPGASGDRVFVARLLDGLRERGHQIELVSRVGIYDFWRGRLPARRLLTEAVSARRRMRRFAPDAWLVYGTSVAYPDPFGWWQRPERYVLLNTSKGELTRLRRPWRPAFAFAHRRSIARADAVLASWPRNAERLRGLAAAPERLGVLPAAVETWDRLPSRAAARRRLGLPAEAPVILCLARLPEPRADGRPWKTEWVLDLLEEIAATPLPDGAILLHAGDGPGLAKVVERASATDLDGRVRLAGPVAHEEVGWLYAACDLFAYVSSSDRPWHAALEAQACGRPVVTLRTSASEMTIEHGVTGLLAGSREELRAQIAALAADRPRCAAMGRAASAYVGRRHSIETRVRQVEELLLNTNANTNGKDRR